jgi:hypothetical protein
MKNLNLRSFTLAVMAALLFCFTSTLLAGPSPAADLLRQAYATLERADHDYKGHRIAAMRQIEAAGKVLGENLRGDGKARERQPVSDEQLRAAQAQLQEASSQLTGKAQKHVNQAIKQLSIALKIK